MKYLLILSTLVCTMVSAQVKLPAASPTQVLSQDFGMGKITVTYSRPAVKGRTVFTDKSELAPLGVIWRTGANAATRITFTDEVTIGNIKLDTGSYVIYTIPGKTSWDVIINKGVKNWGSSNYKVEDDIVRVTVPVQKNKNFTETFAMQFNNVKAESCELQMVWANTEINLPIYTSVSSKVKAQIASAMQTDKKPYWQAATFYFEFEKDYNAALENVNKAIETNPKAYYMLLMKARIQKALGNKADAKATAELCAAEAAKQGNEDYVRGAKELIGSL